MRKEATSEEAQLAFDIALSLLSEEERQALQEFAGPIVGVASGGAEGSAKDRDIDRLVNENKNTVNVGRKLFRYAEKILESGQG